MTLRVAVVGNCHAQYFGAALKTLPGIEVRTVGLAYPGPICFDWTLPTCIHAKHVQGWLDAGERGLVLHQVTADTRFDLYARITANRPYPMIKFPYVKFHALVTEAPTQADIDKDRDYNTGSFDAAGYPLEHLERLKRLIAEGPILFEYNHFSGEGFAVLFDAIMEAGLADYIPRAELDALRDRMKADRGIAHMISPVQRARWPSSLAEHLDDPMAVWKAVRTEDIPPIAAHHIYRAAAARYRKTPRAAYLGIMLSLYRNNRYSNWIQGLVDFLVERKQVGLAMRLLGPRIGWEDARGVLLAKALKLAVDIRRSASAYAVLRECAAKYPDSTLPLLLECCSKIRH